MPLQKISKSCKIFYFAGVAGIILAILTHFLQGSFYWVVRIIMSLFTQCAASACLGFRIIFAYKVDMHVYVCVSARLLITGSIMWHDMDQV